MKIENEHDFIQSVKDHIPHGITHFIKKHHNETAFSEQLVQTFKHSSIANIDAIENIISEFEHGNEAVLYHKTEEWVNGLNLSDMFLIPTCLEICKQNHSIDN